MNFIAFSGKIHLINSDQEMQAASQQLASAKKLGFDTETKPQFKKGPPFKVALLQLATDTDAYLIRLHHLTDFVVLRKIFENGDVVKVGVAVSDDIKKLQKVFAFVPRNFVEMQSLAKKKGLKNFGLKGMTEEVLNAALSKGPKMTNWEARELTYKQLMYAATDAWVGLMLFNKLNNS